MDDEFLIKQVLSGNEKAYRLLVLRYQRMIFTLLHGFNLTSQTVEDLAQDTFLRAFKNLALFDPTRGATFSTWLCTIAKNLALNERSRERAHSNRIGWGVTRDEGRPADPPLRALELQHIKNRIRAALGEIPNPFRLPVILSYFDGLSLYEIARIERCSIGTVKSRNFRGKKILKQRLIEEDLL